MSHAKSDASSQPFAMHGASIQQGELNPEVAEHNIEGSFTTFAAINQASRRGVSSPTISVMGRADFLRHVALNLPDVAARIDEGDFGILHLEMGAMRLATEDAIERHELHAVRRHFAFIAYLYEYATNELHDAIRVSYLEPLFLDGCSAATDRVRSLLPASLYETLRRAELRNALLRATWSQPAVSRLPDTISLTLV